MLPRGRRRFAATLGVRGMLASQAGFSLAEVIAAAAVLSIAVVALLSTMTAGFASVDLGRLQSTAVFLAEQKLEDARSFAMSAAAGQGFANLTDASFPAEPYGSIANAPFYRRTVAITNQPDGVANTKLVEVTVFYKPQNTTGFSGETAVVVSTLVAQR